jgi:FKBP-type peptidyl-prolyl cis-trans isomerase
MVRLGLLPPLRLHFRAMKHPVILIAAFLLTVAAALGQAKVNTTKSGLKYIDQKAGTGDEAKSGDKVQVHYTGWLYVNGKRGAKFDSSAGGPGFEFTIDGRPGVIAGWNEGVAGMKVGGKRELIIPPDLAYGARDVGNGLIPANSTLDFEVELLKIN